MARTRTYKSNIGIALLLPILLVLSYRTFLTATLESWWMFASIVAAAIFSGYLLLRITCCIQENSLTVKCGFLYNRAISVQNITRAAPKQNSIAAPATSLDRLKLIGKFGSIIVSPKNKGSFIQTLTAINPSINIIQSADQTSPEIITKKRLWK